ncbi:MAG TPA: FG-GAP-like repeat-containing protein [Fimbriiglobus sp.]|nr:FG-GAP-like repeat-containing protein [Fimbriiglobus sp.]
MPTTTRPGRAWAALRPETLEDRLAPALTFRFDYSLDTSGFFADPAARGALERAATDLGSRVVSTPAAIAPGAGDAWQATFHHPTTGADVRLTNPAIPEGAVVVYAGGAALGPGEAGEGGPGGYTVSGSPAFVHSITDRPGTGGGVWGGSLSFDADTNWYLGADPAGRASGQIDLYSVAVHELGHLLGFGTAPEFAALARNGMFMGSTATAVYGSAPPLAPDDAHWAQGTRSDGSPVSLQPVLEWGRVPFSELDYAALQDIGWQVAGLPGSPALPVGGDPAAGGVATGVPAGTPIWEGDTLGRLTLVSGPTDGSLQAYTAGADGRLAPVGPLLHPFGNFGGPVRATAADVNGDGFTDVVAATGPGGGSRVRVLDGRTFQDLVTEFAVFESSFTGGLFVSSGDFNHDGRDELVFTPDQGGGPRVRILTLAGDRITAAADFFGIDDPGFRGGARSAVGDVNADGVPDLVVSAGFGGGPRVSLVDGASVLSGSPRHLGADFFAFEPGLRNGAYVAVADADGDGWGDLVFGAGPGGGPRVLTLSSRALLTGGVASALATPLGNAFAGDVSDRGGVRVTAKDFDGDGHPEVIAGSGTGSELRVYKTVPPGLHLAEAFAPFGAVALDGVYVG